jgi:hypothetical protein
MIRVRVSSGSVIPATSTVLLISDCPGPRLCSVPEWAAARVETLFSYKSISNRFFLNRSL